MLVPIMQGQVVLHHKGRQPHVVGRNRRALLSKLPINGCVMVGSLVVGKCNIDAGLQKKSLENPFIFWLPASERSLL